MKPMFCPKCGAALDEQGRCPQPSCVNHDPKTARSAAFFQKALAAHSKLISFSEKGKPVVPDCVEPDLDEVPIKQYDIARLQTLYKGAMAEGRLQVTNKRILFRSSGGSLVGPTALQYEFSIEETAGIEIRKEAHFNVLFTGLLALLTAILFVLIQPLFSSVYNQELVGVLFTILIAAASVLLFFLLRKRTFLRYLAMSILVSALPLNVSELIQSVLGAGKVVQDGAILITFLAFLVSLLSLAFAPNLVIRILTKGGGPAMEIRRKDGFFSFQHNEYTGFSQVMPGPDTNLAIKELGSLLREIQQTGTYADK